MDIQLKELKDKLKAKNITLEADKKAREKLGEEGYDPDFGARPLRRLIQREIQDALALKLLEGIYKQGDKINISVDEKTRKFRF